MIKKKYIVLLLAAAIISSSALTSCSYSNENKNKITKQTAISNKTATLNKFHLKSDIADIDSNGNIFIKQNNKYIGKLSTPKFLDTTNLSKDNKIPFTNNSWTVSMRDKNCGTSIQKSDNELNVKFNYPNFATVTSPYYPINSKDTGIYKFVLDYSMTSDKVENVPFKGNPHKIDPKKRIFPFSMFTVKFYDKDKKLIDKETTRAYIINDGKTYSLFDYSFVPKKNTSFVTLDIAQFNLFKNIKLKNAMLQLYPNETAKVINQNSKISKNPKFNEIVQNFTFPGRKVVRTIHHDLNSNILNVTKKVTYAKEVQNFQSYEPISIKSNSINYIGRDLKYHKDLKSTKPYVTDYTTPYFSKFDNNNILSCSNGYTSVETTKEKNNFNINIYKNNCKDTKYFVIGDGGIYKYTYTQKFSKGTTNTTNYSLLLDYKGNNVIPSRSPNGTKGTFIITHHADSNTAPVLKALMLGSSKENSPFFDKGGFLHYKLPATWAFFAKSGPGNEGIDSKPYKDIIDLMNNNGIEVVPHSIDHIAGNNTRDLMEEYMPILQKYNIENWTDHSLGHGTRCSDIKSDASVSKSPYFSLDLFKKFGYKYCWSYDDVTLDKGLDMLRSSDNDFHPQTFFKNYNFGYNDYSLYQWSTYRPKSFIEEVNKTNLDEIVSNNGIAIMHDYFTHPMQLNKFFIRTNEKEVRIKDSLNNTLKLLFDYRKDNGLWIPTVRDFINYSVAVHNVDVSYTSNGVILNNKNKDVIKGYTLITLDDNNNKKYVTMDLKPGKNIVNKF